METCTRTINSESTPAVCHNWTIPRPSRHQESLYSNTNRNALQFFQAAGIKECSEEKKAFQMTIQALHSQYLDCDKYMEEQEPGKVNRLIDRARIELPWLNKYEDCWPALIYLKRYVDTRRPYLGCSRHSYQQRKKALKTRKAPNPSPTCSRRDWTSVPEHGEAIAVKEFLCSLQPSLERQVDAFVNLGIKDEPTLQAFLSWPDDAQAQLIDGAIGKLQITSLERKGLLIGCGLVKQKVLQESLVKAANGGHM